MMKNHPLGGARPFAYDPPHITNCVQSVAPPLSFAIILSKIEEMRGRAANIRSRMHTVASRVSGLQSPPGSEDGAKSPIDGVVPLLGAYIVEINAELDHMTDAVNALEGALE